MKHTVTDGEVVIPSTGHRERAAAGTPEVGMRTVEVDLSLSNNPANGQPISDQNPILLGIVGNSVKCSLILDTSVTPKQVTTDAYAWVRLNGRDGWNPAVLFAAVHGNAVTNVSAIWFEPQPNRKMFITYLTDTPASPVDQSRG